MPFNGKSGKFNASINAVEVGCGEKAIKKCHILQKHLLTVKQKGVFVFSCFVKIISRWGLVQDECITVIYI